MDVKEQFPYKFILWTVDQGTVAPHLSIAIRQGWPYAPHQEVFIALPYAARALLFFLSLTLLLFLILGVPVDMKQIALLAALSIVPFLFLMTGDIPHPHWVTPKDFGGYQLKTLPVLALITLAPAGLLLRRLPRPPLILTLLIMAIFMGGYPLVGLYPDEGQRKSFETYVQAGMLAFIFLLSISALVRKILRSGGKADFPHDASR